MAGASATLSATRSELRLDSLRLALAPAGAPPGSSSAGPVITAQGRASRADNRIHAEVEVDVDAVTMSDLSRDWPAAWPAIAPSAPCSRSSVTAVARATG